METDISALDILIPRQAGGQPWVWRAGAADRAAADGAAAFSAAHASQSEICYTISEAR